MTSVEDDSHDRSCGESSFPTKSGVGPIEEIGTEIGPYKLLSVLGEGGFAIVYLAEQKHPVRRQVALKLIKPGMDSKQVIARFEAERQALALLDHPNIARVLDGGATDAGRPYFVLELVKGLSITQYCDHHKLTIEERLELFRQVCEAVQHAHQKGIIHRDIKPSNILVPERGGKPVPLIIDFGVAKAISQPLTERTLFTEQGQFVGTPEYMSPEQAGLTIEDIDTRSDIYSLGVLLYELLTGTLPFSHDELARAGFAEIQRIIRETDPPRPSTRLSSLGDEAKKIAERRRTEIRTLTKRIHKELEWIPLKAMRKERDRRYKTASELADDVRNYLNGDPLIAGPESATYRLKKVIKRHRAFVTGVAAILVVLAAGIAVSTLFAIGQAAERRRANHNERLAKERLAEAEAMVSLLNSANRLDLSDSSTREIHLEHVAGSSLLQILRLQNTQITDADLANLKDVTSLEILILGGTKITDVGMANLKNLRSLRSVCLHKTHVSDAGLACLKNLTSLEFLCLADTNVSNAGLIHLKGLTSLQQLRLEGTRVSNTGLQEIRQALPDCRIEGPHPSIAAQRDAGSTEIESLQSKPEIPAENLTIPEELQTCAANLREIYTAIKKHEEEKGRLPNTLSDLIPAYIGRSVLYCPNDPALTGAETSDPNVPYSYHYEFSSIRIPEDWPVIGRMRFIDWKKQQMELFGDVVPMVRCSKHGSKHVNVSAGGDVYISPNVWEKMFVPDYTHGDEFPAVARDLVAPQTTQPRLVFTGTEAANVRGTAFTRYYLAIENYSEFPDELFRAAPDLPPIGKNTKAARTQVHIMSSEGKYLYGFAAFPSSESLTRLWFAVREGAVPPKAVYVILHDRQQNVRYKSNTVSIDGVVPEATGSLVDEPLPGLKGVGIELPADAQSRMLLVCFWDMDQRPSRQCIARLASQAAQLSEKAVMIVTIHAGKVEKGILEQWVNEHEIPFPTGQITDDVEEALSRWGVTSLPYLVLTDKTHKVIAQGLSLSELAEEVEKASR